MSHLSTTIHVEASPEVVFDLIADPARGPEWQTLLADMGDISGRPGGVGSSYTGYYRIAGRRLEGRFVVTAAERPKIHQAAGTTRGGWARWTTVIEAADGGADVQISVELDLPGEVVGSLFGMLTSTRLQQAFETTYANMKQVAEADAHAHAHAHAARMVDGDQSVSDESGPAASVGN